MAATPTQINSAATLTQINSAATLTQINSVNNSDFDANVIFIHGLNGNSQTTWMRNNQNNNEYWLRWLSEEDNLGNLRVGIWSYGYEARPINIAGHAMSLEDRARNLLDLLESNRLNTKPLIFVVHSYGGLLVKKMLKIDTENENGTLDTIKQTKGVVFLATPHNGARLANYINALKYTVIFRPTIIIKELQEGEDELRNLLEWYSQQAPLRDIATKVYFESRRTFLFFLVVDEHTANPQIENVDPIPVSENHINIARPQSRHEPVYSGVRFFIEDKITRINNNTAIEIICEKPPRYENAEVASNLVLKIMFGLLLIKSESYTKPVYTIRNQTTDETIRSGDLEWDQTEIININPNTNYQIIVNFKPVLTQFLLENFLSLIPDSLRSELERVRWSEASQTLSLQPGQRQCFRYIPHPENPIGSGNLNSE